MTTCSKCKTAYTPICKCPSCGQDDSSSVGALAPCPTVCSATVHVQDSLKGKGVDALKSKLDGAEKPTDANGFANFADLAPGAHAASVSLEGAEDKYAWPGGQGGGPVTKTIAVGQNEFYAFVVDPLTKLKVSVKRRHDGNGIPGAKVKIAGKTAGNTPAKTEDTTPAGGEVGFTRLRQDTYQIDVELDDTAKAKHVLEQAQTNHALDMSKDPDEIVVWARLVIHLRLKYKDPDDTARAFPKDFAFQVVFDDATTLDLKVLDDTGYFRFEVPDSAKTKFTLKFDSAKLRYLVHEDGQAAARVVEDPAPADLRKLCDENRKFFALPKTWSLVHAKWDVQNVTVPQDGQIVVPADGIGTAAAPAELTLRPKLQYVRLQFFDRKFGHGDHADQAVAIPPVVLKAVREADASGVPQSPVAGTHDAISNWPIDPGDRANACQCLPWVVTRKDDGADLPKFNNKLMFEFGEADLFVHSLSASSRRIEVIPAGDDRRKPGRERHRYYDLPAQWKSCCWYTRFADASKNKFFDELAATDDADLEASTSKGTKLTFCLDDLVLVAAGSQALRDQDDTGTAQALSEHSRVTMLYLDPGDKHKVKVHKPRAQAAYWSESEFVKETATTTRRNVIVDVPVNPRVVVFCDGFYDIWDKRTTAANFGSKELLGARAATLEDTTISSQKIVFNQAADTTAHYVHRTRAFHMHYLHYGATDGTTVYGAIVTMWTCRLVPDLTHATVNMRGTWADVDVFREQGMERAMTRWNEKDYFFEEADDKRDVVVKHFCLFEAKDVKTGVGAFVKRGGPHTCKVTVVSDRGRSSATTSTMTMRKSGAVDEGDSGRGPVSGTNPVAPFPQYDGAASPKSAFAHELGHAAIGLWDDYITDDGKLADSDVATWNGNDAEGDRQSQRYLGMPYDVDDVPLMKSNRALRLRYFWGRAKWLNDKAGGTLNAFLGGRRFRIAYEPAGGAGKLKYSRPAGAAFDSIYVHSVPNPAGGPPPVWALGNRGRCELFLYHLGDDEFSKNKNGGPYNGILVVGLKVAVCFRVPAFAGSTGYKVGDIVERNGVQYKCKVDHTSGLLAGLGSGMDGSKWDPASAAMASEQKLNYIADLDQRIMSMMQDRFKLQGSGIYATTYLRIFPQWQLYAVGSAPANAPHFTLEVVYGSSSFTPAGTAIVAGTGCNRKSIIRYMFGKIGDVPGQWPAQGGLDGDLTKDDLPQIKAWMDANAGGRFNVGAI